MDFAPGFSQLAFGHRRRAPERGYFYCHVEGTDPITGPDALSTEDLTGLPAGDGKVWFCQEVPIDEVAKYTTKVVNTLDKLGFYLFG